MFKIFSQMFGYTIEHPMLMAILALAEVTVFLFVAAKIVKGR